MSEINWVTAFTADLVKELVVETVKVAWNYARLIGLTPREARHFRELSLKVRDMPFIYRDLGGDVEGDFVDIDMDSTDPEHFGQKSVTISDIDTQERLRNRRRALIIGAPGIGKTTLLRHTILHLIQKRGRSPGFISGEYLVPFYVPLKALDNTEPFPIIRYLLANNTLLQGWRGERRLLRLANSQRLILFLDAYDEIPSSSPTARNFIEEELRLIFAPDTDVPGTVNHDLYGALSSCRIWLSSRPDFLFLHPLPVAWSPRSTAKVRNHVTVMLRGVGSHRGRLIKIIFDKYRSRSSRYAELLSGEWFEGEIDRAADPELTSLSSNPLFLTVMCYIYVKNVIDAGSHEVSWASSMPQLITECVSLLLRDLDEEKVRELRAVHRAALLRRRNEYRDEKFAFLHYFAGTLIREGRSVFDIAFLHYHLQRVFGAESKFPTATAILRGLAHEGLWGSSVAAQLIYCGIFVVFVYRVRLPLNRCRAAGASG